MSPAGRPFRFSVALPPGGLNGEVRTFARKAEDLGFDLVAAPDHLVDSLPPFLALMHAADATSTLKVATMVLNNDLRHPALVAREAAALQELSGGRFELGLGAGHAEPEYRSIGLRFDPPSVRVTRLAEAVPIMKRLLAGETVDHSGTHYELRHHRPFPVPVSPPQFLIGGNGRDLLRLAARTADIVGFTGLGRTLVDGQHHETTGFGPDAVGRRLAIVREAAGARFSALELNTLVQAVVVTERVEDTAAKLASRLSLAPEEALQSPYLLLGSVARMVDVLHERRDRWGFSYVSVFAHSIDMIAPVVAKLR